MSLQTPGLRRASPSRKGNSVQDPRCTHRCRTSASPERSAPRPHRLLLPLRRGPRTDGGQTDGHKQQRRSRAVARPQPPVQGLGHADGPGRGFLLVRHPRRWRDGPRAPQGSGGCGQLSPRENTAGGPQRAQRAPAPRSRPTVRSGNVSRSARPRRGRQQTRRRWGPRTPGGQTPHKPAVCSDGM